MGQQFRVVDLGQHLDILHQVRQVVPDLRQRFREKLMRKVAVFVAGGFLDEILEHDLPVLPLFLEGDDAIEFTAEGFDVLDAAGWWERYLRQLGQTFCVVGW